MRTTPWSRHTGWLLVGLSLALHLFTVYAFSLQPDRLAAFTVMPIWAWGFLGLTLSTTAFYFLRAPLSLILSGVWALTILLGADEARVIANFGNDAPEAGEPALHDGLRPIRVLTLNCALFNFGDPSDDIAVWEPDVVLLQEAFPHQIKKVADKLYGGHGDYRAFAQNGIITRWKITREVRNPDPRFIYFNHNATVETPDGRVIEIANIHLSSAATDLRLWEPQCWRTHRANRDQRRIELSVALEVLAQTTPFPERRPVILAGDFNAPPSDPIQSLLKRDFEDAFLASGTGWGDTFQRRIPILRLDRIHTTRHFTPIRCRAHTTKHSDHRMVIADLLLP